MFGKLTSDFFPTTEKVTLWRMVGLSRNRRAQS